jgi:chemotaxis response regulator CheB
MPSENESLKILIQNSIEAANKAAHTAAETKGVVDSLRSQTADQWSEIKQVREDTLRHAAILETVVRDQKKTTEALGTATKTLEELSMDYRSDKKALGIVKWIASIGGLSGLAAIIKDFMLK